MNKPLSARNSFIAAAFLMATSAVGPGFLTQTSLFTEQLLASFGFVILITIILDIVVQLNIWRVIVASERRAQDVANAVYPGLGYILALFVVFGGLAFNIGNIAGAGMGLEILLGLNVKTGAILSCMFAIGVFLIREAALAMDRLMKVLGLLMICLTIYVAWQSNPPIATALHESIMPEKVDLHAILTLVGGTVGGYITFAGAHRLIDSGIRGNSQVKNVTKSAISAIGLASIMRIILFLGALGVVVQGVSLDPNNPAGAVFKHASGNVGHFLFGIVLWCAAISSVVGAAYTSVSFIKSFSSSLLKYERFIIIIFILISTLIFVMVGRPVKVLILAGAVNGLVLPFALSIMLIAANNKKIMGDEYQHNKWLTLTGILVAVLMAGLSFTYLYDNFI